MYDPLLCHVKNSQFVHFCFLSEQTTSRSIAGASHVGMPRKAVRFRDHTEVRVMTADDADEANLARLSYNEYMRKLEERARLKKKFPVPTVCKLALIFCVLVSYKVKLLDVLEHILAQQNSLINHDLICTLLNLSTSE